MRRPAFVSNRTRNVSVAVVGVGRDGWCGAVPHEGWVKKVYPHWR